MSLKSVLAVALGIMSAIGGFVDIGRRQYTMRFAGRYSLDQFSDLVLDWRDGRPIRLGDIATIQVRRGDRSDLALQNGNPALSLAWISRDMMAPAPPVIANGMVFALSTGGSPRQRRDNGTPYTSEDRVKMGTRATLYVLDGGTGKELYSSGNAVAAFAPGAGISFANGRAYFGTYDSNLYSFGIPIEH